MRAFFTLLFSLGFYFYSLCAGNFIAAKMDYKFIDSFKIEVTVTSYIHACGINYSDHDLEFITVANNSYPEKKYNIGKTSFEYAEFSDSCKKPCEGFFTATGYRRGIFKYIIDLSSYSNYCNFRFVFQPDLWPGNLTNIVSGYNFYADAELNLCSLPNRNTNYIANSPIIKREPFFNVISTYQADFDYDIATQNNSADSLYFEMIPIRISSGNSIPYQGSFTFDKPLTYQGFPTNTSPNRFIVDHQFGHITFKPSKTGEVSAIGIKVSKYVKINGSYVYVGYITMNHIISVYDKSTYIYQERNLRIKTGDTISNFDTLNGIARRYLNICKNDSLVLKVPNSQNYSFQWYKNGDSIPGATSGILIVKDTGLYKVKTSYAHDTTYCFRYSDSVLVWSPPKNTAVIGLDSTLPLCSGEPVPLKALSYPGYKSFKWLNNKTVLDTLIIDSLVTDSIGNYFLEVIDTATCIVRSNTISPKFILTKLNLIMEDTLRLCDKVFEKLKVAKGMKSYHWSTGDTTDEVVINHFGDFYINVKDTNSCTQKDSIRILKVTTPDFNLGKDTLVCEGNLISISLNISPNKDWEYSWNSSGTDTLHTFKIIDTGIYSLKVISEKICPKTDSIIVKRAFLPIFDLGKDLQICKNTSGNILLNIQENPTWVYEWEGIINYNKPYIPISDTGTTIAKVTDMNLCTYSDTIRTTYFPEITLQKPDDQFICVNPNTPIKIHVISNAKYYKWDQQNVDTSSFFETDKIGTHHLELIDENGCKLNDTVEVKEFPMPRVFIGNDTSFCYDDVINLTLKNQFDNGYQYNWQGNVDNNSSTYEARDSGIYTLKVIDSKGCFGGDTIQIYRYELKSFETKDTFICDNNPVLYKVNAGYQNYDWNDDIDNHSYEISIINPGTKILKVTDQNNCVFIRNFKVDTLSSPYFLLPDTAICGTEYVWFDLSHINASIVWNNVFVSKIYEARKEEKIWATAKNACGIFIDSLWVKFCTPQIYIPSAFTPNGDGLNDIFQVLGNVQIKDFFILNRWGEVMFQSDDINHGWDGTYNGSPCQEGIYPYYVFYQDAQKRFNYIKGVVNLMR